jgi:hypothetical protein
MFNADQTERTKRALAEQLDGFLGDRPPEALAQFRARIAELLAQLDGAEVERLLERVSSAGSDWGYFPPEPFARDVNHAMADVTLTSDSGLEHAERLIAVRDRTLVLVPNHISYSDANLLEILLHQAGSRAEPHLVFRREPARDPAAPSRLVGRVGSHDRSRRSEGLFGSRAALHELVLRHDQDGAEQQPIER